LGVCCGPLFFRQRQVVFAQGFRSVDAHKCQALFDEFKKNGTWQVPTLTVNRLWGRLDDNSLRSDKRLAYIDKKSKERWQERIEPQTRRWGYAEYQLQRSLFAADQHIVGFMFRAGVPIMAGTDAMNPYCFPGFSLHDELALLIDSGMTPLSALQAATINPARFLGRTDDLGIVAPGKIANMVLLDADPLADIRNTTRIRAVWLEGRLFDRASLDRILEEARQHAGKH
jgi:Amidohydrolase family